MNTIEVNLTYFFYIVFAPLLLIELIFGAWVLFTTPSTLIPIINVAINSNYKIENEGIRLIYFDDSPPIYSGNCDYLLLRIFKYWHE